MCAICVAASNWFNVIEIETISMSDGAPTQQLTAYVNIIIIKCISFKFKWLHLFVLATTVCKWHWNALYTKLISWIIEMRQQAPRSLSYIPSVVLCVLQTILSLPIALSLFETLLTFKCILTNWTWAKHANQSTRPATLQLEWMRKLVSVLHTMHTARANILRTNL